MNKVSIVVTVFNEEDSVLPLVQSLLNQEKEADEIVVVDGGSKDGTVEKIKSFKNNKVKLIQKACTRSEGRNIGVQTAKNEKIAITDADCVAQRDWLKNITEPFETQNADMVAGFYRMETKSSFQKAASVFLGVLPQDFDQNFLASTRSMAFKKKLWKKLGGFREDTTNIAEDTEFNFQALKAGVRIVPKKDAVVNWKLPDSLKEFSGKILTYAKWDAMSKIFWHPGKKLKTHNLKILMVFARYLTGLMLFILYIFKIVALIIPEIIIFLYLSWAFCKVFRKTKSWKAGAWGIVLQIVSDMSVMMGFLKGVAYAVFHSPS